MSDFEARLDAIFTKHGVVDEMKQVLKDLTPPITSLENFVNLVDAKEELKGVFGPLAKLDATPDTFRISALAGIRASWESARREVGDTKAPATHHATEEDDGEIISSDLKTAAIREWAKRHPLDLLIDETPSDQLMGRIMKKVAKGIFDLIPLERVVDAVQSNPPETTKKLGDGITLSFGTQQLNKGFKRNGAYFTHTIKVLMHAYVLCSLAKESQNEKPFCSLRLAYRYAEHIERQVRIYSLVDGGNMSNIAEIERARRAEWLSYLQQNPDKILDDAIQHSIDRLLPLWPSLAAMAVCPPATEGTTKRREQICENYLRGTCREKKCRRIHPGAGEAQSSAPDKSTDPPTHKKRPFPSGKNRSGGGGWWSSGWNKQ